MRLRSVTLITSLIAGAPGVIAAPPSFQDARAFAMGGTGVASSRPASASFYNPALLSIQHKHNQDDFNITIPSVNARLADDEDVVGQVEDIQDTIEQFNAAVNRYEDGGDIADVQQNAGKLQSQLRAFDQDAMRADVGIAVAMQKPGRALGVGVFASAVLRANVTGDFTDSDDQFLSDVIAAADGDTIPTIDNMNAPGSEPLQSSGRVIAAAMTEVGLNLSREFTMGGSALALGVSPKFVELRTFDYRRSVTDFEEDDFEANEYETRKSGFNMDLGAAYTFGEQGQWVAGASVRNVIPMSLRTVSDDKVEVDPRITVGLAYKSNWHTLAVDLDLTENKAFSFEDDTQWLSVGGEVDVFDSLQLRAGARHNIAHDSETRDGIAEKNQLTAGLALSPFGARFELGALFADGEFGGAAELGLMF